MGGEKQFYVGKIFCILNQFKHVYQSPELISSSNINPFFAMMHLTVVPQITPCPEITCKCLSISFKGNIMQCLEGHLIFVPQSLVAFHGAAGPESLSTQVARNSNTVHMLDFNVFSNVHSVPFFSTDFASISDPLLLVVLAIGDHILTLLHH